MFIRGPRAWYTQGLKWVRARLCIYRSDNDAKVKFVASEFGLTPYRLAHIAMTIRLLLEGGLTALRIGLNKSGLFASC